MLAGPPLALPRPGLERHIVRIETVTHPMPRPRPLKRWSQGELDERCQRAALLLDQG